ncbi:LOW QUALITY PROTEIN: NKG2-A/NKG2-B type II integral membrane protein-like [Alexandromys fortis]|uniref:LOW QUALITY PROTEIN: NKG2-A/NKG2-B type II integral membrane protein-like n=1 Tax=Alexandromys fortis TaxID=100897 RepID=UPI002152D5F1|nr:LOW QUALITY PROTEIN: NKG2-A/NKG2-B type II integral membrane protein-like [Microtus fortis]
MSHLLRTERGSRPREAAKETQGHSQLHFSYPAGNQLMEFSLHNASQKHLKNNRHSHCKKILSPPEKLISVILGIVWFALLVTLLIMTRTVFPYNNLSSAHPCGSCPKEWMSYSHNCYYISVQKKNWTDSLVSCNAKNSSLLYIESEEEQNFLQSLSLITWTGVFRKSRDQPWVLKKDSTFKPRITELFYGEHNCVMLSTSGLPADDCAVLHTYLCKHKLTN